MNPLSVEIMRSIDTDALIRAMSEQGIVTPDWIRAIMETHQGGWAYPFSVTLGHPLLIEGWMCFDCDGFFRAGDVVTVMPFHGEPGDARWVAYHRDCLVKNILPDEG